MRVSTIVCPRAAVGRSETGRFLEGSLGGLTLWHCDHTHCVAVWQRTQHIALRCQGRSQKGIRGAMFPNRRLSGFLRKNWLCWDVGPALFSTVKFCRRRLKRSTFLRKNALALSFCSNQCKILATPLCIASRRRGNAIVPISNNDK